MCMLAHSHTIVYPHQHVRSPARICTHTGTSVQRTPSILNPDPGLGSVFTCKWYTTICGPFCLLCPSSRLGPGRRAGSQMGRGDHIRWAPMFMEPNAWKKEGRGWLTGSHWNSRDSHIAWKKSMDLCPSLTGEQERDEKDKEKGLPV